MKSHRNAKGASVTSLCSRDIFGMVTHMTYKNSAALLFVPALLAACGGSGSSESNGTTTGAGAIAGGMIGGGVGAVVGAGIGAGASTVVWLRQDRQAEVDSDRGAAFQGFLEFQLRQQAIFGDCNESAVP